MDENVAHYLSDSPRGRFWCRHYMKWLYFPMFDHHIAVSQHTAGDLREASYGHDVRRGVWVRPMGAACGQFRPERRCPEKRQWLRALAGAPDTARLLLYAGRLVPEKNLQLLVETLAWLEQEAPYAFHLLVAAKGRSAPAWSASAISGFPARRISWATSPIARCWLTSTPTAMASCAPIRASLSVSRPEAMASGLPLVAPSTGGIATYAGSQNAWLADPDPESFARTVLALSIDPQAAAARCRAARATAQSYDWDGIAAGSLPLLHRADVGSGSVVWRESALPGGATLRLLEFTGFSRPDRAAGLNRLGFLRELSRMTGDEVAESLYLGLMTSSPEESVEEARQALHTHASEVTYTAINGRVGAGDSRAVTAHFTAPAGWSIDNQGELLERAWRALFAARNAALDTEDRARAAPPFLQALACLLRQPARSEASYAYGGRLYRLWLNQSPDPQATAHFRARGLLAADAHAIRASGRIRHESGGPEKHFRIWVQEGAPRPLPLRIEYPPKSYLRLVFEAES